MKQTFLLLAVLFTLSFTFTSCSKDDDTTILPPMFGYWQCTSVGVSALGLSTDVIPEEYVKYFSIGYAGVGTNGTFIRIGADTEDLPELANLVTSPTDLETWKKFLTTGTFTYVAATSTTGTITHTSSGESKTYNYEVSDSSLKLTEVKLDASSGTSDNILGSILGSILNTTGIDTTAGVVYTYKKLSLSDFTSLLSSK